MAIHWQIPFKSLRGGTDYIVNIYDSRFSGTPIVLNGGSQPFTTQEDDSDDMFTPVRTQSGYLRIVDNNRDANGNLIPPSIFYNSWWQAMIPSTDTSRPVTLTVGNTVMWQGFMQAQNFGGVLYGNPQEREFPVQCPLAALNGESTNFNNGLQNFAYIIKEVCDVVASRSDNAVQISNIVIQGGSDARAWLMNKIDWQMFASEDNDGVLRAKNTLIDVLTDMCQFWGWTARTHRTTLYLTCADDSAEQTWLTLTREELNTLAGGTPAGTVSSSFPTREFSGDIFASINQNDSNMKGPHTAEVRANIEQISEIMEFAPQTVRDQMEQGGYTWVSEDGDVGYFTTPNIYSFTSAKLNGQANSTSSGFCRRQLFGDVQTEDATICDMIIHNRYYNGTPFAQLQTTRQMPFGNGSLKFNFDIYTGANQFVQDYYRCIIVKVGIGMTRASAKWLHLSGTSILNTSVSWTSSPSEIGILIDLKCPWYYSNDNFNTIYQVALKAIPLESNLYGYLFIDLMGSEDRSYRGLPPNFELANFSVMYSRNEEVLATGGKSRTITRDRTTSCSYTASNNNSSKDQWNADCIFATDNSLEYGFGLLTDASGNIVSTVGYGSSQEHPEQHLADRVANYWNAARRKLDVELRSELTSGGITIGDLTPQEKVKMNSTTFYPFSIGREWRDDIIRLTMLQL